VKGVCENKRFYEWTEESVEFVGCRWKDIRSSSSGGAIYINEEEGLSISINECFFMNISTSGQWGGSIECVTSSSSFLLSSSLFFNTSAKYIGGCDCDGLSLCFLLHNSSFEKCFASFVGSLGLYSLSISDSPLCSSLSSFGVVFGCVFKQDEALNGDGGGLLVSSPPSSFSIRSCLFDECKAKLSGGGIYFYTLSSLSSSSVLLYYCFFSMEMNVKEMGRMFASFQISSLLLFILPFFLHIQQQKEQTK
jgi:hypothetical protein